MVMDNRVKTVGRCAVCLEFGAGRMWFTFINPRTGKQFFDRDDRGNSSWYFNGSWVLVCDDCRHNTRGLLDCEVSREDWN